VEVKPSCYPNSALNIAEFHERQQQTTILETSQKSSLSVVLADLSRMIQNSRTSQSFRSYKQGSNKIYSGLQSRSASNLREHHLRRQFSHSMALHEFKRHYEWLRSQREIEHLQCYTDARMTNTWLDEMLLSILRDIGSELAADLDMYKSVERRASGYISSELPKQLYDLTIESWMMQEQHTKAAVATFSEKLKVRFECQLSSPFDKKKIHSPTNSASTPGNSTEADKRLLFKADSIRNFESEYLKHIHLFSDHPQLASKVLNAFLKECYKILLQDQDSPTWGMETAAKSAVLYVGEYLFARLYHTMLPVGKLWFDDSMMQFKRESLKSIKPNDLGLFNVPGVEECPGLWSQLFKYISYLDRCYSPLSKVECMNRCIKNCVETLQLVDPKQTFDADTCLSVLVYLILHAPSKTLMAHIKFVEWFSGNHGTPTDVISDELGYSYTQWVIAIQYVNGSEIQTLQRERKDSKRPSFIAARKSVSVNSFKDSRSGDRDITIDANPNATQVGTPDMETKENPLLVHKGSESSDQNATCNSNQAENEALDTNDSAPLTFSSWTNIAPMLGPPQSLKDFTDDETETTVD